MDRIYEYLKNGDYALVQREIQNFHIADIAEIINKLEDKDLIIVFRLLNKDIAAEVFANLDRNKKIRIVDSIKLDELHPIIDELHLDDKVDLLEELPANVVKNILRYSDSHERNLINQFLNYKEDSAGSIMTIEYISLKPQMTVEDSLLYIRKNGLDKETIYNCYVLGPNKKLIGVVSLRELVTANRDVLIDDLMSEDIIFVHTDTDQEEVADVFSKYDLSALPVVDTENRLTGIVTFDDILHVMEQETTEDFHIMASMTPSEGGYLSETPFKLAMDRVIWLVVLLISGIFVGNIIENYNWILLQYLVLNSFIPMITGAGGNSGIQSSTLAVRNISLGEITFDDKWNVVAKEFQVGLIVGGIMGVFSFVKVLLIDRVSLDIGLVVALTMFASILVAKVFGGLIPILADKVNIDPAIMSSSIITTLVDAVALAIYFTIAAMILPI
jgi:magnesium transporter